MSVQKTRALLVDVARQLFAKNGFEDTSMNDIAVAANRGRRTLYTYFNSKEEIYLAVIQTELERLYERMEEVARKPIQPEEKMVQLIFAHLEVMKEAVYRNGNLRAEFFRDVWKRLTSFLSNVVRTDYTFHTSRKISARRLPLR